MKKREQKKAVEQIFDTGAAYAHEQIKGDYFQDWVRQQLAEAARMPPDKVLPLKTKADAQVIARNMLQDLKHDIGRDLDTREILHMSDVSEDPGNAGRVFMNGVSDTLDAASVRDWLAEELLEINDEMRRGGEHEEGRHSWKPGERRRRAGNNSGGGARRRVRDYAAIDSHGRTIAGPFKSYSDAKREAGPAGLVKFVPGKREVREGGLARRFRVGSRVVMNEDALDNYGKRWQGIVFVVTDVSTKYMPSSEFFSRGRPTGYHPGFDPEGGSALYSLKIEATNEPLGNDLYDWELEPAPGAMKPRRRRGPVHEAARRRRRRSAR